MTDLATALARVEQLRDEAELEIDTYEKGSPERRRQFERFRSLDALSDAATLEDWLGDMGFLARWIACPEEQEPVYFARLALDFCPPEHVAELASWEASRPWLGSGHERVWEEEEAAAVRRAMSHAMVLHADLLTPDAPKQKARARR